MDKQELWVSIDVDFLFNTHIYNKYIDTTLDYEKSWSVLKARLGPDFFRLNDRAYLWLKSLIMEITGSETRIELIDEHDDIHKLMKESNVKDCKCVNVDAHSDVTYYNDNSVLNIENWAGYAKYDGYVKDYIWIHHEMSDIIPSQPFDYKSICYSDISPKGLGVKADCIVICLSRHFTPIEYHHLPLELKMLCLDYKESP